MNCYTYDSIKVGQEESFTVQITEDMMNQFYLITGDENPMHHDSNFAVRHQFREKVVFGMLTASFISTLAGVYLPGKYCIIRSVENKFLNPVYIGDVLTVRGIVENKHDSVKQVDVKVVIINQEAEKVVKGMLKAGVYDE